jgi:transglutaminase-like putative cysteine protease
VWAGGDAAPSVEVTSKFETRDRAVDLAKPGSTPDLSAEERRLYTSATDLIPVDGIVKETADKIAAGAGTDLDKARRIYEWIVDNTHRDPKTRGCGVGDIASMLRSGNLGGKCADLNALYVGLARAVGLPARDVYGLRVVPSKFGYRSLGAGTENVTKAQHCRAESVPHGLWVGARRSRRRAQGRAGGAARQSRAHRPEGRGRTQGAARIEMVPANRRGS